MRSRVPVLVALLAVPIAARAQSPVVGRLSPAGLGFLETAMPQEIPNPIVLPDLSVDAISCPGGGSKIVLTQRNTEIELTIRKFDLTLPSAGLLRADVVADVHATGQLELGNLMCDGHSPVCDDRVDITGAGATIDFSISWDAVSGLVVDISDANLDVTQDRVDIVFSSCLQQDLANDLVTAAKNLLLDGLVGALEDIARTQLAPALQGLLEGLPSDFGFDAGIVKFEAQLSGVAVDPSGITVSASADVSTPLSPAECLGPDPGEPGAQEGDLPDFSALAPGTQVGVGVNLGLADDAFHALWRTGLACMTGEQLAAYGVDLDLGELIDLLPGWPPGTKIDLEVRLAQPPTVKGEPGENALVELSVPDLEADLYGRLPDGSTRPLFLDLDATVTLSARYDQDLGALVLEPRALKVDRLEIGGAPEVAGRLDAAHLARAAETRLAPAILRQLGAFAVALPLPGFGGYHAIPRAIGTTDAYVWAAVDLFRAPDEDATPPDTRIVEVPTSPVDPKDARLRVGGEDDLVPEELLRFQATVDGVTSAPTFLREVHLGAAGETRTVHVAVAAVDLAGNVDPTPVEADVVVDGAAPHLHVDGEGVRHVAEPVADLSWAASDDLTPAEELAASVTVDRLTDPADPYSGERVEVVDLAPGATTARIQLAADGHYVLGVTVRDAAGNETVEPVLVVADAASGCGCSAAGGSASPLLLLALALPFLRRRGR